MGQESEGKVLGYTLKQSGFSSPCRDPAPANKSEVLLMECRTCRNPIAKLDDVYPEFKRVLLKDGIISPDEGMGIYDIRCFKKLLKESKERSRIQEILKKAGYRKYLKRPGKRMLGGVTH